MIHTDVYEHLSMHITRRSRLKNISEASIVFFNKILGESKLVTFKFKSYRTVMAYFRCPLLG